MQSDMALAESKMQRLILFVCFVCGGLLIFLFGANTLLVIIPVLASEL
jgi:hypothetical protein